MGKDGVWGGGIELHALSAEFSFNVIVHSIHKKKVEHILHKPLEEYPVIHLSLHVDDHYNSVRRADD
jgi:hypothetical protein